MHLGLYVCLSGLITQNLLLRFTRFFYTRNIRPYICDSVLLQDGRDPDLDTIIYLWIFYHWEMDQIYHQSYAIASEVLSSLIALFIFL